MRAMIPLSWRKVLEEEWQKEYFKKLEKILEEEYQQYIVFPPKEMIFTALELTPFEDTKVVILGQDPYHGDGQAHGLAFSVPRGIPLPPSLKNIFREISHDFSCPPPKNGCLEKWAKQGVLLLNTILTVRKGEPRSHRKIGWTRFTDSIISALNNREKPVVFVLWGGDAKKKKDKINRNKHPLVERSHPSPLSAYQGFLGTKPFSEINEHLKTLGYTPIIWNDLETD
ncbi:MAG: uracil-DNA glycosylase [Planctomycetota bacterium]|nr:MAG: uracil-DNA glycosylase [Planctomycetota bacterium]